MPSNVTYEYAKAQRKYEEAKTLIEKLAALQEMRSTAPQHKGAEKLRREITKKIARLKSEIDKQKSQAKKTGAGRGKAIGIKKEGDGQIVIVGAPNIGKSTLLNILTNAEVKIAPYAFSTVMPTQGMVEFKGAKIQLVEIPGLIHGASEGKGKGTQLIGVIRNADGILFIIKSMQEFELIEKEFNKSNIKINSVKPNIIVKHSKFPGINITGKQFLKIPEEQLIEFLKSAGYSNGDVILGEPTTLEKVSEILDESIIYEKSLFICKNPEIKSSIEKRTKSKVIVIQDFHELTENQLFEFKKELIEFLGKILVYTKKPGQEADLKDPLVLNKNDSIEKLAFLLHKDIAKNLKYAKLWGSSKFPGQRVPKEYKLQNGDIVELYS